jgi:hypothetical protein
VARSLRKELDALMKAEIEQSEAMHEAMKHPNDLIGIRDTLRILVAWNGSLRRAILRLAEEVDGLLGAQEPDS